MAVAPLSYLPCSAMVFSMYLFSSPLTANQGGNHCYPYINQNEGVKARFCQKNRK